MLFFSNSVSVSLLLFQISCVCSVPEFFNPLNLNLYHNNYETETKSIYTFLSMYLPVYR